MTMTMLTHRRRNPNCLSSHARDGLGGRLSLISQHEVGCKLVISPVLDGSATATSHARAAQTGGRGRGGPGGRVGARHGVGGAGEVGGQEGPGPGEEVRAEHVVRQGVGEVPRGRFYRVILVMVLVIAGAAARLTVWRGPALLQEGVLGAGRVLRVCHRLRVTHLTVRYCLSCSGVL